MNQNDFYNEIESWLLLELEKQTRRPMLVGLSGAQGIGKTTLSAKLVSRLEKRALKSTSISIDDFYLTRDEQQKLTDSTNNSYLQQRGYPGTHDVELGKEVLLKLKNGEATKVPRYDKSQFSGLGDRKSPSQWATIKEKQDVVILEGWMLGFIPQKIVSDPFLEEINHKLKDYDSWNKLLDILIYLKPKNLIDVIDWRIEAEKNMRAQGLSGMTDTEAKAYVEKFIPAYRLYRESLNEDSHSYRSYKEFLISKDRNPQ